MKSREVVVVGAGPVGLSLALGLARKGRDVLVLEQNETTSEHSRAPAIWPATQEILRELGVVDAFLENGIAVPRLELFDVDRERVAFRAPLDELSGETSYPHLLVLPQSQTEKLLLEALERASVEVRFSCRVTGLIQHPGKVEVQFRNASEDAAVDAGVVAGCDGAHSMVREAVHATAEGITYSVRAALADIRMARSSDIHFPRFTTDPRLAIGIRIGEDLWRLILPFLETDAIALDQRVEDAAKRLFERSDWEPVWQSEFRLHRRISSVFAEGRVALAGDAAHINSPVGGQGMNAGIQDTPLLVDAMIGALENRPGEPLVRFGRQRREDIRRGVNRFTDILTRVLLAGNGRLVRPVFRLADLAMRVAPVRRRILRRLAMLDQQ